jgi:CO/xanthine dehydrogenase Mo-binding subunit
MTATPLPPCAIDQTTARKALKLIQVDYEILPHVTDVDEALKPSARLFIMTFSPKALNQSPPNLPTTTSAPASAAATSPRASRMPTSSSSTYKTEAGIISRPHACVANVSPDGQGELWVCTQDTATAVNQCAPFSAWIFQAARHRLEIGGGFGGKPTSGPSPWRWHFRARPTAR